MGIILASIVAATAAFSYFSGAIGDHVNKIVAAKQEADSEAASVADVASLQAAASQATQYDAAISTLIPDQSGLINFSTWVSQIAATYQVSVSVAYQGDPTPPSGNSPGTAVFTMTVQGPEGSVLPFIDYLSSEAPGFIVSFTSFNFANDQTQETFTAQGVTYFR